MSKIKTFDRQLLLDCAEEVLGWIALQDPMFEERIQITKDEYNLDSLQTLASYVARTLDLGEHMFYCEREFMMPNYSGHLGERLCTICSKPFTGGRGIDTVCSEQACMDENMKRLDAAFEERQNGRSN